MICVYLTLTPLSPTRSAKRRSPTKKHSSQQEEDGSGSSRPQHFNFGAQNALSGGPLDPYILSYYHSHGSWGDGETREEFKERLGTALLQVVFLIFILEILLLRCYYFMPASLAETWKKFICERRFFN